MMGSRTLGVGWICAVALIGIGRTAQADVVISQPVLGGSSSFTSNVLGNSNDQRVADDFTTATAFSINSLTWWGSYSRVPLDAPVPADSFQIAIYSALNGSAPIASININSMNRTTAGSPPLFDFTGSQTIFQYQANLPIALTVPSGTHYISIVNHSTPAWGWVGTNATGSLFAQASGGSWQTFMLGDRAVVLDGIPQVSGGGGGGIGLAETPEPSTMVLSGIAGLGLAFAGWRRSRSRSATL